MKLLKLINPVQTYAWGSVDFIQKLISSPEDIGGNFAELWMGAHPKSSSKVVIDGQEKELPAVISQNPEELLGREISSKYNSALPFLFKVLAADSPLSIQVHPSAEQAKTGYERENSLGIPLDAENRNYRDKNQKQELICALTPFYVMSGFRSYEDILSLLRKYFFFCTIPSMLKFMNEPAELNFRHFFSDLLFLDNSQLKSLPTVLLNTVSEKQPENAVDFLVLEWIKELAERFPGDFGIFTPLFMNIYLIEPFQAIYLKSGVPHSYLKGCGMEIMTNSDNVIRAGLTPKHIDKTELLNIMSLAPYEILPHLAEQISDTEYRFFSDTDEFCLSYFKNLQPSNSIIKERKSAEILFCYEGEFKVKQSEQTELMIKGQALFVPYSKKQYEVFGEGILFRAAVKQ